MTPPTTARCQWIDTDGNGCAVEGSIQPKRWVGCFCERHGQVYEALGRGLLVKAIELVKLGRELRADRAA